MSVTLATRAFWAQIQWQRDRDVLVQGKLNGADRSHSPSNSPILAYVPHKPISLIFIFSSGETMLTVFQGVSLRNKRNTKWEQI